MPFFRPAYLSPEASFFQLLSELDQPQQKSCAPRHHRPQTFTPRFDVTEVENAYELYGELPGIEQSDISIEFSDAQTIVIKGKTERPTNKVEVPQPEATTDAQTTSEKAHNPTVEDEYDEADTPLATPATTATVTENEKPQQEQQHEQQTPKPKYWVAERRVGSFARSFSFSQRIDQDAVQASLKNGILRVVVPKVQKPVKVVVNVL
jgi:HSP20 family protein